MLSKSTVARSLYVVAVVGLAACDADRVVHPNAPAAAEPARPSFVRAGEDEMKAKYPNVKEIREEEAGFFALDQLVPGAGGYFYDDDGNLVVYVKDKTKVKEDKLKQLLNPVLDMDKAKVNKQTGVVVVKTAKFSFPELAAWRDAMTGLMGRGLGVVLVDADEGRNLVRVGVSGEAGRAAVEQKAKDLKMPKEALEVSDIQIEVTLDAGSLADVGSSVDPVLDTALVGGRTIYWDTNRSGVKDDGDLSCTLSFVAYHSGNAALVTNSHCSHEKFGKDNTKYWMQIDRPFTSTQFPFVGSETFDKGYNWCWEIPSARCRHSDANIIYLPSDRPSLEYGYIAQIEPGTGFRNPQAPSMKIVARTSSREGQIVFMTGKVSGTVSGPIQKTCTDVEMPDWGTLKCQHEGGYSRQHGDSGGPVWSLSYYSPDGSKNVDVKGIHWGEYFQMIGNVVGFKNVFYSPVSRIEHDFGPLEISPFLGGGGGGTSGGDCSTDPFALQC